jgi:hypothetical protein
VSSRSGGGKDAGVTHDGLVLVSAQRPVVRVAGVREERLLERKEAGGAGVIEEIDGARSRLNVGLEGRQGVLRLELAIPVGGSTTAKRA